MSPDPATPHDPLASIDRPRMIVGPGTAARAGELVRDIGGNRVLCVSDPGVAGAGHLDRVRRSLEDAGLHVSTFVDVHENPTTLDVEAGLSAARAARIDCLVGLGGGSAMDCAKGINFLVSCGGRMEDYRGKGKATAPLLPMLAIPTTAGTGSENQSFALISEPRSHQKMACGDKKALPRAAILDPELTLTCPRSVTAAAGMDAISHAVEAFVTTARTPVSDLLARHAWQLLSTSFEKVLREPLGIPARAGMLLGASLAGAAIENSMLGAAHAAANPLTAHSGLVHGQAVCVMLPHIVRFNSSAVGEDYRELLALANRFPGPAEDPGDVLALWIERALRAAGFPLRLGEAGVRAEDCAGLARAAAGQWTARFNPKPISEGDFLEIYRRAL